MTGHGSTGEFMPYNYHIKVNGTEVVSRLFGKEIAELMLFRHKGEHGFLIVRIGVLVKKLMYTN
jgi:hypothetical protein